MSSLFAFKNNIIYSNINEKVRIFSKYTYDNKVTVKIESNSPALNGFYQIDKTGLILEFDFEKDISFSAVKIWGAVWDLNSYLDVKVCQEIKINKHTNTLYSNNIVKYSKKIYDTLGFSKRHVFIEQTDNSVYELKIHVPKNVEFEVYSSNNIKILSEKCITNIVNTYEEKYIEILFNDFKKLGVLLEIKLDNYNVVLPGQEIENIAHLYNVVHQIKTFLTNKLNIKIELTENSIKIFKSQHFNNNIVLKGAMSNYVKYFKNFKNKYSVIKFEHLISDKNDTEVKLYLKSNHKIKFNTCNIHIRKNNTNHTVLVGEHYNNKCILKLSLNESYNMNTKWYLYSSGDFKYGNLHTLKAGSSQLLWIISIPSHITGKIKFNVKGKLKVDPTTINIKHEILTPKIYHELKVNKKFAILHIKSNQNIKEKQTFDVDIIDGTSKHGIDFQIQQQNFTILPGQHTKKLKFSWLTQQKFRQFKIKINDRIIPISWTDQKYYPTNIRINDFNHDLNRGINKALILKYFDKKTSGEIKLDLNQTRFDYIPTSDEVLWQLYDQNSLIWEKVVQYNFVTPHVSAHFNFNNKFDKNTNITLKLSRTFNTPIKFKIISESNINMNLNKIYEFKISQNEIQIPIKAKRIKSIGWLVFRLESITKNITTDSSKKIMMFD